MPTKTISFTPKDFLQGLSPLQQQQNTTGGFFAQASGIDMYRYPGFIAPGSAGTLTNSPANAIISMGNITNTIYGMDSGYLYRDLGGNSGNYLAKAWASLSGGGAPTPTCNFAHSIIQYRFYISSSPSNYVIYFSDKYIGVHQNVLPDTVGATSFYDDWSRNGFTIGGAPSGGGFDLQNAIHRAVIFNGILFFTNGNTIGYLDGTGTNPVLNMERFLLPANFTAKDIRSIKGNLEIYADDGSTGMVITWDGVSTLASDMTPIDDTTILAGQTVNGFPILYTSGRGLGISFRQKNYYGYPQIAIISGNGTYNAVNAGTIDVVNGMAIFADTSHNSVFTYGTPFPTYSFREDNSQSFPESLQSPYVSTYNAIGALLTANNKLYVASSSGGVNNAVETFGIGNGSATFNKNATFKTNFNQLPDDSTIEYVRFFVLPPASGAAFTPTLYTDMNTSPISLSNGDLTSTTLDANGKSKTYYDIGQMCDNFALGGAWANSASTANSIIITRIDVGFSTK